MFSAALGQSSFLLHFSIHNSNIILVSGIHSQIQDSMDVQLIVEWYGGSCMAKTVYILILKKENQRKVRIKALLGESRTCIKLQATGQKMCLSLLYILYTNFFFINVVCKYFFPILRLLLYSDFFLYLRTFYFDIVLFIYLLPVVLRSNLNHYAQIYFIQVSTYVFFQCYSFRPYD